jgi:hypothetical protein
MNDVILQLFYCKVRPKSMHSRILALALEASKVEFRGNPNGPAFKVAHGLTTFGTGHILFHQILKR